MQFYTLDSNDGLRVVYYTDATMTTGYVQSALMYLQLTCSDGARRSIGRDAAAPVGRPPTVVAGTTEAAGAPGARYFATFKYQGLDVLADLFGSNPGAVVDPFTGMTAPAAAGSARCPQGMALRGLRARVGTYTPSSGQPPVPVMRYVSAICGDILRTPARCS